MDSRRDNRGLAELAEKLALARQTAQDADLNRELAALSADEAYEVQRLGMRGRGPVAGYKIGWADPEARKANSIPEPIFGRFAAADVCSGGGEAAAGRLINPAIEGEIVFFIRRRLAGSVTAADVLASCAIGVGLDLMDSRLPGGAANWLAGVADNCGAGLAALGQPREPGESAGGRNLAECEVTLLCDGIPVASGWGRRVARDPAAAIAWLAGKLSVEGAALEAGQFVLSGAIAGPVPLRPGALWTAEAAGLGAAWVKVTGGNGSEGAE